MPRLGTRNQAREIAGFMDFHPSHGHLNEQLYVNNQCFSVRCDNPLSHNVKDDTYIYIYDINDICTVYIINIDIYIYIHIYIYIFFVSNSYIVTSVSLFQILSAPRCNSDLLT